MKKTYRKIIGNKNFLRVWVIQAASMISAFTLNFVIMDRIFSQTGSAVAIGLFLVCFYAPPLLLGPLAGVFIDSLNKKKIFIYSNLAQALLVLIYLTVGSQVWPFYALVLFYSFLDIATFPSIGASLPLLVEESDLMIANSHFFITSQFSILAGSIAAGVLLKIFASTSPVFLLTSLVLLTASIVSVGLPNKKLKGSKVLGAKIIDLDKLAINLKLKVFVSELSKSYIFLRQNPKILLPILLLGGNQGIVGIGLAILPSTAGVMKITYADSAFLIVTPLFLGAIIGGLVLGKYFVKLRKKDLVLKGIFTFGLTIFGSGLAAIILQKPIWLVSPLLLLSGGAFVLMTVPLQTIIQEQTPFDIRGKVFAILYSLLAFFGLLPIFLTTTLTDIIGVQFVLLLGGLIIFTVGQLAYRHQGLILDFNNKNND